MFSPCLLLHHLPDHPVIFPVEFVWELHQLCPKSVGIGHIRAEQSCDLHGWARLRKEKVLKVFAPSAWKLVTQHPQFTFAQDDYFGSRLRGIILSCYV